MPSEVDDTRCIHWPESCADVQARTPTCFQLCDFCLFGPVQEPIRDLSGGISEEEMIECITAPERQRGEKLRQAVEAMVQ